MYKVCHLTSVHKRNDIRIFIKECKSLSEKYDVSLIVADGEGNCVVEGVKIFDVGKPSGRKERMMKFGKYIFEKAISLDADLYHFHDPELMPVGIKLKKAGKKVIYDVHEDLPRQLLTKPYLNKPLLKILSFVVEKYENWAVKKYDFVITATSHIRDRFLKVKKEVQDVNNYPILDELKDSNEWKLRKNEICYIGGISEIRGIRELIKSLEYVNNVTLHLAGSFDDKKLQNEIMQLEGWKNVKFYGFVERKELKKILKSVKAGMLLFHPVPNHTEALPNKMFEYLSAGIPVIASDFQLWQEILYGNKAGICVNPLDPKEIAEGITKILSNDELARVMGENGEKAVIEKYNWGVEKKKLFKIYEKVLSDR